VVVTEVKPTAALRATLEGFRVMPMDEAAKIGDIFITATGMKDVLVKHHFESMKDGAIVCNTGHYDCEINLVQLGGIAQAKRTIRPNNEEYMVQGKRIYVLAQGRLVNLAAAEGHPSEVMDMSFANQFNALLALHQKGPGGYPLGVHVLPAELDQQIAMLKLKTQGVGIDTLTAEQIAYATDYSAGT